MFIVFRIHAKHLAGFNLYSVPGLIVTLTCLVKWQLKIRKHGPQQDSSLDLLFYNGPWQHAKHQGTILRFSIILSWIYSCTNMTVPGQVVSCAIMLIKCFSWFKLPCWFSVGFKFSKGITKLIEKEQTLTSSIIKIIILKTRKHVVMYKTAVKRTKPVTKK